MRRIRTTIAYDGTDFHGWQVQPGLPTIQAVLESVVSEIEGHAVHAVSYTHLDVYKRQRYSRDTLPRTGLAT